MAFVRKLLSGFIAGELDPLMGGRVDTDQYEYGLSLCENFTALEMGPLVKRSGFEYIRPADPTASWLSAFRFSILQEYVLEWDELKVRKYTNGGRIEDGAGNPLETVTPYHAAEAPYLNSAQSYDRLYIDHPAHPPGALVRTDAVTFTYEVSQALNGPFADENVDTTKTVTVSATTGTGITITASSPIFTAGMVGSQVRLEALDFSTIKAWEPAMDSVTVGMIVRSDGKAYTALTAGTTGSIQPTHTEGSEWDGLLLKDAVNAKGPYGILWQYRHDKFGIATITAVGGGGTSATADVVRTLPDSLMTVPSWRWSLALFSQAAGWPSIVVLWEGRLAHFKGFDLVASVAGDYGGGRVNYATFTDSGRLAPDLSFRRTLATNDPPLWATADRKLVVGTASKELAVGPLNSNAAISGDNIQALPQSFYGSQDVDPVQVGVQTLFVERGGRRLRASDYDFARDRYSATDMTASARSISQSGIIQLAYQREPWPTLYGVRGDGQVIMHSYSQLPVKGFSRIVLGGGAIARSAVAVVGADGVTDELWILADRTASGHGLEMWKQVRPREIGDPRAECFFVDGGSRVEAAGGTATFSLPHRKGDMVDCLINGAAYQGLTVDASGTLTLPPKAVPADDYVMIVGLPFTATAITMAPDERSQSGSIAGLRKRVRKAVLRLIETIGIRLGGDGPQDSQDEAIDRRAGELMDNPIPLVTDDIGYAVDTAFDKAGRVRFSSNVPLPAIITAAMLNIETDQGDA